MSRFVAIVSVVAVAIGLLVAGAVGGDLTLVYVSIGLAALALLMLIVFVAIWREQVFGPAAEASYDASAAGPHAVQAESAGQETLAVSQPPPPGQPSAIAQPDAGQPDAGQPEASPAPALSQSPPNGRSRAASEPEQARPAWTLRLPGDEGEPSERPQANSQPPPERLQRTEQLRREPEPQEPQPQEPQPQQTEQLRRGRTERTEQLRTERLRTEQLRTEQLPGAPSAGPTLGPSVSAGPDDDGPIDPTRLARRLDSAPEVTRRGGTRAAPRTPSAAEAPRSSRGSDLFTPTRPAPGAGPAGRSAPQPAATPPTATPPPPEVAPQPAATPPTATPPTATPPLSEIQPPPTAPGPAAPPPGARESPSRQEKEAEAAATASPQQPSAAAGIPRPRADSEASASSAVSVVPGIARYHMSDCILIRFLSADDLQTMSRREAEASGCVPCRACRPERTAVDA